MIALTEVEGIRMNTALVASMNLYFKLRVVN